MDGVVNAADITILLSRWNCAGQGCTADINGDWLVNAADLTILLADWD
jgi:hypothetical protein